MVSVLIKNIGALVTGNISVALRQADSIYVEDGLIREMGNGIGRRADKVIDARDLATGAAIVCTFGFTLLLVALVKRVANVAESIPFLVEIV